VEIEGRRSERRWSSGANEGRKRFCALRTPVFIFGYTIHWGNWHGNTVLM